MGEITNLTCVGCKHLAHVLRTKVRGPFSVTDHAEFTPLCQIYGNGWHRGEDPKPKSEKCYEQER